MFQKIKSFWDASITRQLLLGISFTHALLMSIFIFDLVEQQHSFLKQQNKEQAIALARTLAANSTSWLLSQDFVGIEEIITSQSHFPGVRYVMLMNDSNKLLGHSDRENVGFYVVDELSQTLLSSQQGEVVLYEDDLTIDVAVEVLLEQKRIGWARVALDRSNIVSSIEVLSTQGIIYTFLAILVGIVFAWLTAKGLTHSLSIISSNTKRVREGERNIDFRLARKDELGLLAEDIHQTVTYLSDIEAQLETYQTHMRDLVEQKTEELSTKNIKLEESKRYIELKKDKLEAAYIELQIVQEKLVESEKMASLGALVIGIAHELNTPLGVANTAITNMQGVLVQIEESLGCGQLTQAQLMMALDNCKESVSLVLANQSRAILLLNDFKKMAMIKDVKPKPFNVLDKINLALSGFSQEFATRDIKLDLHCPHNLDLYGDHDLFIALFEQLIKNSFLHGFDSAMLKDACITIHITETQFGAHCIFKDNGKGLNQQLIKKIFDPFYTTRIGQGSGGLGMYLVYNIVSQAYSGDIECKSSSINGAEFSFSLHNQNHNMREYIGENI